MSKFRNAYEKAVDWALGVWFNAWVWQMKALGVELTVPHEVLDAVEAIIEDRDRLSAAIGDVYAFNKSLMVENEGLKGHLAPEKGPDRPNAKKLTEREVADIHAMHRSGVKNVELARMYDVNPATISRIVRGLYYSAVA